MEGTHGAAVIDELAPHAEDFQVTHPRISGFFGTNLDPVLRARGIHTVVVTGCATNVAVDSTVRDALQLGYEPILLENCCCSSAPEFHEAALKTGELCAQRRRFSCALSDSLDSNIIIKTPRPLPVAA